jgi:hypothetical protein
MTTFATRLEGLDTTLFSAIASQSSENDQRSLLACQLAVRSLAPGYIYLEIGSHLGGSIQSHLLDESCAHIYSIDKRTAVQLDERGVPFEYPENTTQRMLERLSRIAPDSMAKLTCIDGDSRQVPPEAIERRPELCFIDGEHTDRAALDDFRLCLTALADRGAIVFHDSQIIYNALQAIVNELCAMKVPFHAYNLPDSVFVIELGEFPMHEASRIQAMLIDNHIGYLAALHSSDPYRRFANRAPFKFVRRLKAKLWFAGR